jgi:hypothetical protein
MDDYGDELYLKEARDILDTMTSDEIDGIVAYEEPLDKIIPYYRKALPKINKTWIPIMIQADILRQYK